MPQATTLDSFLSDHSDHIAERAAASLERFSLPADEDAIEELKRRAEANARRHESWSETDIEENMMKYHRLLFVHALGMRDETEIEVVFSPKTQRVRTREIAEPIAEPTPPLPEVGAPTPSFELVPDEKPGVFGRIAAAFSGMFRSKVSRVSIQRTPPSDT